MLRRCSLASRPVLVLADDPAELSGVIEELVSRFGCVLGSVVGRFRMSAADADELIQEVRIRLWRALADGMHTPMPAAYFTKVVRSAAVDLERRRRRTRTEHLDDDPTCTAEFRVMSPARSTLRSPERQLEDEELGAQVARAVDALAKPRDQVVRLHLVGYDRFEIADLLGWTEAKTRNLLYRGLEDLRETLRSQGIQPGRAA